MMKESELRLFNERKKRLMAEAAPADEHDALERSDRLGAIDPAVRRYRRGLRLILWAVTLVWVLLLVALVGKLTQRPPQTFATTQDGRVISVHPSRVVEQ